MRSIIALSAIVAVGNAAAQASTPPIAFIECDWADDTDKWTETYRITSDNWARWDKKRWAWIDFSCRAPATSTFVDSNPISCKSIISESEYSYTLKGSQKDAVISESFLSEWRIDRQSGEGLYRRTYYFKIHTENKDADRESESATGMCKRVSDLALQSKPPPKL